MGIIIKIGRGSFGQRRYAKERRNSVILKRVIEVESENATLKVESFSGPVKKELRGVKSGGSAREDRKGQTLTLLFK